MCEGKSSSAHAPIQVQCVLLSFETCRKGRSPREQSINNLGIQGRGVAAIDETVQACMRGAHLMQIKLEQKFIQLC